MAYYIIPNGDQVLSDYEIVCNLRTASSASTDDVIWVEPFGINTHFISSVQYVDGSDCSDWAIKNLYYYKRSSEMLDDVASTTSINPTERGQYTNNIVNTATAKTDWRIPFYNGVVLNYTANNQSIGTSSTASTCFRKTVGAIIDTFPTVFPDTISTSSYTPIYWAGGPTDTPNDLWSTAAKTSNVDITESTHSTTTVYNIPIITNTTDTIGIESIELYFSINLVQLLHGNSSSYANSNVNGNFTVVNIGSYQLSASSGYRLELNSKTPYQFFSYTPVFNYSSGTITGKPLSIFAELSGTSVTLAITQPYATKSVDGVPYTWCGYTVQMDVDNYIYTYQTTTNTTTTSVNGNLIQYDSSLERRLFAAPNADVNADDAGVALLDQYALYVPAADTSFYGALTTQSAIGVMVNPYTFTNSSSDEKAHLQDNVNIHWAENLFKYYTSDDITASLINNYVLFYLNPWNNKGSTRSEFLQTYTDGTMLQNAFGGTCKYEVRDSSSSSSTPLYTITSQSNYFNIISASTKNTIVKFPITTYDLTIYTLRKNGNYLYNEGCQNTTLLNVAISHSAGDNNSCSTSYLNSSGTRVTSTSASVGTVTLVPGADLYFTASGYDNYKYSAYTTYVRRTATLTFQYTNGYNPLGYWGYATDTLTYTYSAMTPSACVGVYCYCYSALTYNNTWGASTSSYSNSISTSYTSTTYGSVTSLSYSSTSKTVSSSTMYLKLSATIDTSNGRYRHRYVLYRAYNGITSSSQWTKQATGTYYNPKYQQKSMGSYTTSVSASTNQPTYYYYWGEETAEINYPTISKCVDAGNWKRTITIYNPNDYTVTIYYTSNKCTSSSSIDSSATWSYAGTLSAYGSFTKSVSDRSGYDDAYIAVGIDCGSGYHCVSWYSESASTSPSRLKTAYVYHS